MRRDSLRTCLGYGTVFVKDGRTWVGVPNGLFWVHTPFVSLLAVACQVVLFTDAREVPGAAFGTEVDVLLPGIWVLPSEESTLAGPVEVSACPLLRGVRRFCTCLLLRHAIPVCRSFPGVAQ